MSALFATELLGWKASSKNSSQWAFVPNCADIDSQMSLRLAAGMLDNLGVPRDVSSTVPRDPGKPLERKVADDLTTCLPRLDGNRFWQVKHDRKITDFIQYEHLREIDRLVLKYPELRVSVGRDYLISPDVTVGLLNFANPEHSPFLHAAASCKWTIRSDRVQNIRHEFNQMIRHRRGRQPHLVTVTAEPLPTRLRSIACGTGEVDAVYHIAMEALAVAVEEEANDEQLRAWSEIVGQGRLLSYDTLADTLATW
jgi:hypothetical protein